MRPARSLRTASTALALLLLSVFVAIDGLSGSATSGTGTATSPSPALELAADTSQFRAGNIISDDLFFDGDAMSAGDVQAFLDGKGAACVNGPMPCLKNYRENTWTRAADAYCGAYAGAPGESAAWIITRVGQACGISQRVLLVLLQKEQGLVRASGSSLTLSRYQKATGYGCPDTAPCDVQYYGFYNQVYNAARRFKVYAANPQNYNYRAGRVNSVLYNPDASCGRSDVYIENQATAGLYVYTPYQPNAATLAAGYGSAPCGAYGNRNFWLYYTDWFGSTQSPGGNAVVQRALASSAQLGAATSSVICGLPVQGGCFQAFRNGSVYWSPSSGARIVKGDVGRHWAELGWETGLLGYPTSEEICGLRDSGCFQEFQGGVMYWSPATGAHPLFGALRQRWNAQRWETGPLGYPTEDEVCGLTGGGCLQRFQGGTIYWSRSTGARIV
ncbi:LGFP repeat-containing protein, partial [Blastococcus sp. SYSU D00813]